MAKTYKSQFIGILKENERRMTRLFSNISAFSVRQVMRMSDVWGSDDGGTIPVYTTYNLQQRIADIVTPAFLGTITSGNRAPYRIMPDGTLFPISPYMTILWDGIQAAQRLAVERHAGIMTKRLANAPDVLAQMKIARGNPFRQNGHVREQIGIFTNPLAQYDPAHLWLDPRGYRLSDRIWRTAGMTRRKLDLFLEQSVASGRSALEISRDLETFLMPGRTLRTRAPYGTDASYDAMRLARTEITRAHAQASEVSALLNPFVEGIGVRLSLSHPKTDICDEAADASPFPKDGIPPQYAIPMHPHDLCTYYYTMKEKPGDIVEELRADVNSGRVDRATSLIGPLLVGLLLLLLNKENTGEEDNEILATSRRRG